MFSFTSFRLILLKLLLLSTLIYSFRPPEHDGLIVHHQLQHLPPGYTQIGKPSLGQMIELTIGLVSPNMGQLETRLYQISDTKHEDYGKHLTKQETEDLVRPDVNVVRAVMNWLSRHNIKPKSTSSSGHRIYLKMSVAEAERAFNTTLELYNHISTDTTIIRARGYSVPGPLADHIRFVYPIIHFPSNPTGKRPRHARSRTVPGSHTKKITRRDGLCDPQNVTVNCVMDLYHIPTDTGVPRTKDNVLVLSFLGQTMQAVDVAHFMQEFRPDVPLSDVQLGIISIDGGDNPQGPGVSPNDAEEADLDVQMVAGINPKSRMAVVTTSVSATDFLKSFDFLLNQDIMATVVSMSYGTNEPIGTDSAGIEFVTAMCHDIMQLTARGATVVVGSGDGGVAGMQPENCVAFVLDFPASCPFVLSVGATQLSSGNVETAASLSGGGFSNLFPMPPYQTAAVNNYLSQLGSLNSGLYNSTGRGHPDISAIGVSMRMINSGPVTLDGTSVSAPLVAGILAAVNDIRRANGKASLGFINPWLYANQDAFTDITQGSNPGCNTNGFPAMEGWDPVTGLGTPLFDKLLNMP